MRTIIYIIVAEIKIWVGNCKNGGIYVLIGTVICFDGIDRNEDRKDKIKNISDTVACVVGRRNSIVPVLLAGQKKNNVVLVLIRMACGN